MHCPPAIWPMQTREPEHHPERKRNVIFQTSIFKFHMILLRWFYVETSWNLLKFPQPQILLNEIFVSNSIEPYRLALFESMIFQTSRLVGYGRTLPWVSGITQAYLPPKTNGWNLINTALKKEKHRQTTNFEALRPLVGSGVRLLPRWWFFCEEGSCGWSLDSARCPFGAQLGGWCCWLQGITSWIVVEYFCLRPPVSSECLTFCLLICWCIFFNVWYGRLALDNSGFTCSQGA